MTIKLPLISLIILYNVEIDRHFIKQNLEEKIIQIPFVKSKYRLAYILTNALSSKNFYISLDKLGITNLYAPTRKC